MRTKPTQKALREKAGDRESEDFRLTPRTFLFNIIITLRVKRCPSPGKKFCHSRKNTPHQLDNHQVLKLRLRSGPFRGEKKGHLARDLTETQTQHTTRGCQPQTAHRPGRIPPGRKPREGRKGASLEAALLPAAAPPSARTRPPHEQNVTEAGRTLLPPRWNRGCTNLHLPQANPCTPPGKQLANPEAEILLPFIFRGAPPTARAPLWPALTQMTSQVPTDEAHQVTKSHPGKPLRAGPARGGSRHPDQGTHWRGTTGCGGPGIRERGWGGAWGAGIQGKGMRGSRERGCGDPGKGGGARLRVRG